MELINKINKEIEKKATGVASEKKKMKESYC
jgi:hypothetical protein